MKKLLFASLALVVIFSMTACKSTQLSMVRPTSYVEFNKTDFEFSDQVTGEAQANLIFGIDFERLFDAKAGAFGAVQIPVFGNYLYNLDKSNYVKSLALYDLMIKNPGYDVVFYPQFEVYRYAPMGLNIYVTYKVKVTARLGKIKK